MKTVTTWLTGILVLAVLAGTLEAGVAEQKAGLRREADWAASKVSILPDAPKLKDRGIDHIGIIVGPPGPFVKLVHVPISNSLAGVATLTEVWPSGDITDFVDQAYLHPKEPRYDKDTILKLGGQFKAAQALLFVHYVVEESDGGEVRVTTDLSLWDGKTAEKLWGADRSKSYDPELIGKISRLIDAGDLDRARSMIAEAQNKYPEWKSELGLLGQKANRLVKIRKQLAFIQGQVDQNQMTEAFAAIKKLAAEGDPELRDALQDLQMEIRVKLVAPAAALIDAGDFEAAKRRLDALELAYPNDNDLVTMVAQQRKRITIGDVQMIAIYAIGGVVAAIILGLLLTLALRKRSRVAKRNRGIDMLTSEAEQAERVKEILQKDRDLRAKMLRELDRTEDALAEAHHQAQSDGKTDKAVSIHDSTKKIQDLRRKVKLSVDGDAQDFLKGRLPKRNLEDLVGYLQALSAQMEELTKEATAAMDSIAAGGDPAKNLKLMSGMALQISGKLTEREAVFKTIA